MSLAVFVLWPVSRRRPAALTSATPVTHRARLSLEGLLFLLLFLQPRPRVTNPNFMRLSHSLLLLLLLLLCAVSSALAGRFSPSWSSQGRSSSLAASVPEGQAQEDPQAALNQLKMPLTAVQDDFQDCLQASLPESCDDLASGPTSDGRRMQLAVSLHSSVVAVVTLCVRKTMPDVLPHRLGWPSASSNRPLSPFPASVPPPSLGLKLRPALVSSQFSASLEHSKH